VATETRTRTGARPDSSEREAREEIERTEEAAVDAGTVNRFDIRRIIGGLFAVYGVILTVVGAGASDADLRKASGININLWTGIGMLVVGALFIAWALWRPVGQDLAENADTGAAAPG
jgi:xanthine/uracil/vitamin C permease (AzgA family)